MSDQELYIGLMSGTSMDAIDAVLVEFSEQEPIVHAQHSHPLELDLKARLVSLCEPGFNEIESFGELDVILGQCFAEACLQLIQQAAISPQQIRAIGSHGQTIRHRPNRKHPFSLQIGDPNIIAEETGITTIADFRRRDIAKGGQGAPLTPLFHQAMFQSPNHNRVVLNLGGIANVTILPAQANQACSGFDTGPGNTLLDAWIHKQLSTRYDQLGQFGATGKPITALLSRMLDDCYFYQTPPKTTGREHFNLNWLENHLEKSDTLDCRPEDIQATLQMLTVMTVRQAIENHAPESGELLVCGGGIHNARLMELLYQQITNYQITSTAEFGIDPDLVEAIAFAWLAKRALDHLPGNLPEVTGASGASVLGGIYTGNLWQDMSESNDQTSRVHSLKSAD